MVLPVPISPLMMAAVSQDRQRAVAGELPSSACRGVADRIVGAGEARVAVDIARHELGKIPVPHLVEQQALAVPGFLAVGTEHVHGAHGVLPLQYSSGSSAVVTLRSHSVMIHSVFSPWPLDGRDGSIGSADRMRSPSFGGVVGAPVRIAHAAPVAPGVQRHALRDAHRSDGFQFARGDRSHFEKLVSSLYPLLEKLTTGKMAEPLSPRHGDPHDPRPIFDWMEVINQRAVVYVGLDSLSDFEVAAAVGNAMFAGLTSTAGKLYKHGATLGQSRHAETPKVSVHAGEFNQLIGDEFVPLLNKAGGAGFQVTVYSMPAPVPPASRKASPTGCSGRCATPSSGRSSCSSWR